MFDSSLFLELSVELRLEVYKRFNSQFTYLNPLLAKTKPKLQVSQALKPQEERFKFYLAHYEYLGDFIEKWLKYSFLLKYDCIVLDYLRVNHLYESCLSKLHWIDLDCANSYIGIFDRCEDLLQVWYSAKEYKKWILDKTAAKVPKFGTDMPCLANLRLDPALVKNMELVLDKLVLNQEYLDSIKYVTLTQEEFISEETLDNNIKHLVTRLESVRYLRSIKIRSDVLFNKLVNLKGSRDHPGYTIGYNVRKRVRELQLVGLECDILDANLLRWENCLILKFQNCFGTIDLNGLQLPSQLRQLVIKNVYSLKWWNLAQRFNEIIGQDIIDSKIKVGETRVKQTNRAIIAQDKLLLMEELLIQKLNNLNYIHLQSIEMPISCIVVPARLYLNKRINIFGCHVKEVKLV